MAGYIPRSFIDELINRVDIVDLIDSYVSLRQAGRNYTACCPFHNENTPSFTVSPDKQFYYCFGCGAHGNAISFLIDYAHFDFVEAVHELAVRVGIEVVYEEGTAPASINQQESLYEILQQATRYYQQQLRQSQIAINYLKQRGLTGEIARDFGLGYAPLGWDHLLNKLGTNSDMRTYLLKTGLIKQNPTGRYYDHFRDRVMFPILDGRGRVVAFGGRVLHISTKEPKYLNSPETPLFQKGRQLYGWYLARKTRPLQRVLVVEGYMDVVALAQHGIKNVVATLGTAITQEHLTQLLSHVPEIIFCFDGDEAGWKAAWHAVKKILSLLQDGRQISFVFLQQGEDPDSLIRQQGIEAFNHHLDNAIPLPDLLFNTLKQQVDMNRLDGQARLVELAKPLLSQLPYGSYRDLMIQKLSELSRVNLEKLTTLIPSGTEATQPSITVKKPQTIISLREQSLVCQAIVCLLHKPELSQLIEYPNKKLSSLPDPKMGLLLELIELMRSNPQLKLGTICEHWRGTQYEQTINQLASQKVLFVTTHVNIEDEFFGAIQRLYENYDNQRYGFLIAKPPSARSADENHEIQLYMTQFQRKEKLP